MAKPDKGFFTYKGIPLVRKGKDLYFGNMYDDYVVWIQVISTKKVGGIEVADKLRVLKLATDFSLSPNEQVVKNAVKDSLYEAMDVACAWLKA